MEEVDKIILHSLKDVGCDVESEVKSLHQFNSELIVEAVVRCLNVIQPGLDIPYHLPPSMSSRFKVGGSIAEACSELGYTGEIGYQTFLYPTEGDIRKVLMFLIEKLPKESDKNVLEPDDTTPTLRQSIAEKLKQELSIPWSVNSVSSSKRCRFISVPLESGITLPGQKRDCTPQEWRDYCVHRLPFFHCQLPEANMLLPSIIAYNAKTCLPLEKNSFNQEPNSSQCLGTKSLLLVERKTWLNVSSKMLYSKERAESIKPMGTSTHENNKQGDFITELENKEEMEKIALDNVKQRLEKLQIDIRSVSKKLSEVTEERIKEEDTDREKEKDIEVRRKALALLPESAVNMEKLELLQETTSQKLVSLAAQWEKHKVPLEQRYQEAKTRLSSKVNENTKHLESAKEVRKKLREIKEQLSNKESLQVRLQEDFEKLSKSVNRSAYTKRILEIIGNIKKQREDITKVVEDTKQLQKDINILTGRLDRSFTVADELIFRDAKKDESSRRAYKLLATLHQDFSQLVAMVEETGSIVREIRDLEDQIDVESAKNVRANLERISADLRQMRKESAALNAQLDQGSSS